MLCDTFYNKNLPFQTLQFDIGIEEAPVALDTVETVSEGIESKVAPP